jgi:hypothetical protein
MKPNKFSILIGIAVVVLFLLCIIGKYSTMSNVQSIQNSNTVKVDSLQTVIDSLQAEIQFQNDGFDFKEHRYEDVISEYEFGIEYLEKYHPEAYRDFHRIIGFKERFRRSDELENKKRLHVEKD